MSAALRCRSAACARWPAGAVAMPRRCPAPRAGEQLSVRVERPGRPHVERVLRPSPRLARPGRLPRCGETERTLQQRQLGRLPRPPRERPRARDHDYLADRRPGSPGVHRDNGTCAVVVGQSRWDRESAGGPWLRSPQERLDLPALPWGAHVQQRLPARPAARPARHGDPLLDVRPGDARLVRRARRRPLATASARCT